jgi:hypothetical protein
LNLRPRRSVGPFEVQRRNASAWVGFAFTFLFLLAPSVACAADGVLGDESWRGHQVISTRMMFGVRGSWSSMGSAGGNDGTPGIGVGFHTAGYLSGGYLTLRVVSDQSIGTGAEGVEGSYHGDLSIGVRAPIGEGHGPFARLGLFRAYLFGNERVWLSNFEVPSGFVGYQVNMGPWLFEIAGRTGMIVTGRHTMYGGDDLDYLNKRKLGQPSAEIGGHMAFGYKVFQGEIEYMRINVADAIGTPLDTSTRTARSSSSRRSRDRTSTATTRSSASALPRRSSTTSQKCRPTRPTSRRRR